MPAGIELLARQELLPRRGFRHHPHCPGTDVRRVDGLPDRGTQGGRGRLHRPDLRRALRRGRPDRKSTRLNSSHVAISYAVFCLKKKNKKRQKNNKVNKCSRGVAT